MKKYLGIIAAIAAIGLCLNAQANNITVNLSYGGGGTLQVVSLTPTQSGSQWTYTYQLTASGAALFDAFDVNFAFSSVSQVIGTPSGGNTAPVITPGSPGDVRWNWSSEQSSASGMEAVSFVSTIPPGYGSVIALDGGGYPVVNGVNAPNVPDGGLTVALLGGALVGLQMLRRKLTA